jgi:hypothetical protein
MMAGFLPFVIIMFIFVAIGVYFVIFTRHFLSWTIRSNKAIHKQIDSHLARPVLEARAQVNYSRLQANGGLNFFIGSIRIIGIALIVLSIFSVFKIFGSI